jgi:hypothetical protein
MMPLLAKWLASSPSGLVKLSLPDCSIRSYETTLLASALRVNAGLAELDISGNSIGTGMVALAQALECNTSLTTLDVRGNNIYDVGALALAQALQVNASLTTLYISFKGINDPGMAILAPSLRGNASVKTFDFDYCKIDGGRMLEIYVRLDRNQQLPQQMKEAGVALELASGLQYPADVINLITSQLPAVPAAHREAAFSTVRQLSASIQIPSQAA